jgi:hypothetical protein
MAQDQSWFLTRPFGAPPSLYSASILFRPPHYRQSTTGLAGDKSVAKEPLGGAENARNKAYARTRAFRFTSDGPEQPSRFARHCQY